MKKFLLIGASIAAAAVLIAGVAFLARHEITRMQAGLPAFTHSAGETLEEMVAMTDSVALFTTIALPESNGSETSFPTVLLRNPYSQYGAILRDTLCGRFVRYGYACVFQDVRGQGKSQGDWVPLENEMADGRDALKWLADQPFQNGNIAMVGPSYLAAVQWAAASAGLPEEVKTLIPGVTTTDNRNVLFQDGMFRHETFTAWAAFMKQSNSDGDENAGELYQKALRHRPHIEVDTEVFGIEMPWYRRMVSAASAEAEQWQLPENQQLFSVQQRLQIPVLMIGGWYDVFFGPQYGDWQRLATRSGSRFIIGPWTHIGTGGEALDTPNAEGGLFQWAVMLDWLNHHLKGEPLVNKPGVASYVMRDNIWKERPDWPPQTQSKRFYLSDLNQANSCDGGSLEITNSTKQAEISYQYDPDNPVPTRGGAGMLAFILPGFGGAEAANVWQDGLCERDDVLTFISETLTEDLRIAGNIALHLTVASNAEDTAFTGKLIEVLADGKAVNIRDSITSLAYRNGAETPQVYQPDAPVDIELEFWPIEWTVKKGSRLRLDVSSSDFPKYHAHPNQAGNWAEISEVRLARQTVFTGPGSESFLELPLTSAAD
jgi:putative CocE/NonD family hydrolase